jgi:hypothetical protein
MSEGVLSIKKAIPIIVVTWILSLVTTLGIVYVAPNIFPPLTTEKIADKAIIVTKLADGSVTSAKILDGSISAVDLADGSIIAIKISDGAITTAKIADGATTTSKIADGAIVTVKLANESITTEKIADGNVTTSKLSDDAITTVKFADGSVTSAKILDGTITSADLADGSIISVKIADGAVTTVKIADYAVTSKKLAANAIPFASITSQQSISTTSTYPNWVDMTGLSVTITTDRTSHLLILVSAVAMNNDPNNRTLIRALVDANEAYMPVYLTPIVGDGEAPHRHLTYAQTYTCQFYLPAVVAGTHRIKIQWCVTGGEAWAGGGILTVIALPA